MARLSWQLAVRDDIQVAQGLYAGEEIEELHELSEAGLLDEFLVFLKENGMLAVLEEQECSVCWSLRCNFYCCICSKSSLVISP